MIQLRGTYLFLSENKKQKPENQKRLKGEHAPAGHALQHKRCALMVGYAYC